MAFFRPDCSPAHLAHLTHLAHLAHLTHLAHLAQKNKGEELFAPRPACLRF